MEKTYKKVVSSCVITLNDKEYKDLESAYMVLDSKTANDATKEKALSVILNLVAEIINADKINPFNKAPECNPECPGNTESKKCFRVYIKVPSETPVQELEPIRKIIEEHKPYTDTWANIVRRIVIGDGQTMVARYMPEKIAKHMFAQIEHETKAIVKLEEINVND